MKQSPDCRIENYSFAKNLSEEEKGLFSTFGLESRVCTPFEAINPQYICIGNFVSINRDMKISVFKDFTHHINFIRQHYPGLESQVKQEDYVFEDSNIVIGDCTSIGRYCFITAANRVKIGKAVILSDRVYISDSDHRYENPDIPILYQSMTKNGSVVIGDHSFIGVGVTVLNCSIGKHCIIGGHSFVARDIPDYSIAVGTPAKVVKRFNFKIKNWEKV
jgi:acetyltransferase-like isoleucine patch superfamily enzyme